MDYNKEFPVVLAAYAYLYNAFARTYSEELCLAGFVYEDTLPDTDRPIEDFSLDGLAEYFAHNGRFQHTEKHAEDTGKVFWNEILDITEDGIRAIGHPENEPEKTIIMDNDNVIMSMVLEMINGSDFTPIDISAAEQNREPYLTMRNEVKIKFESLGIH